MQTTATPATFGARYGDDLNGLPQQQGIDVSIAVAGKMRRPD
jgi:hypothetical protein